MLKNIKKYSLFVSSFLFLSLMACTDDIDLSGPENIADDVDLSDVPSDITDGYSLSFQMGVTPMEGGLSLASRATNLDLRTIEDFVDLEKLRILFFTCLDDTDYTNEYSEDRGEKNVEAGRVFHTGQHDVFLFEAKSRWVSLLSTAEASDASYQVTAPIFPYGNQTGEDGQDYDWAYVRQMLLERPFKIVILVNRPKSIHYSDFDKNYGKDEFSFGNEGPYWSIVESNASKELYDLAKSANFKNISQEKWNNIIETQKKNTKRPAATINELHHCIWDPVYANKNSISQNKDLAHCWYDFIMENPTHGVDESNKVVETWISNGRPNAMGAVSAWTTWMTHQQYEDLTGDTETFKDAKYHKDPNNKVKTGYIMNPTDYYKDENNNNVGNKPYNFYRLPDQDQGIPMYGVQQFDALKEWKEGTPIHLSAVKSGQGTLIKKKTIMLLRSLARIELLIPKSLGIVEEPCFMYSNVYGRCEPMDVATPTNELWDESINHTGCEWNNIYTYGPVVGLNGSGNKYDETENNFLGIMGWFYGAWKAWWPYNDRITGDNFNGEKNKFDFVATRKNGGANRMPYPRIYNTCIQRNGTARLDFTQTTDDADPTTGYYHYVVYTGERNVNDPSKFNNSNKGLYPENAEIAYFSFKITPKGGTKQDCWIAINPYNPNTVITTQYRKMSDTTKTPKNYKSENSFITDSEEWNWPIMRNHAYVFRVTHTSSTNKDEIGLNVVVMSPENRTAPNINFW